MGTQRYLYPERYGLHAMKVDRGPMAAEKVQRRIKYLSCINHQPGILVADTLPFTAARRKFERGSSGDVFCANQLLIEKILTSRERR